MKRHYSATWGTSKQVMNPVLAALNRLLKNVMSVVRSLVKQAQTPRARQIRS